MAQSTHSQLPLLLLGRGWLLASVLWGLQASLVWGDPLYQVHVMALDPRILPQVQTIVPDAYRLEKPGQPVILAGTFVNRVNAERRQEALQQLGLVVQLIKVDSTAPASTSAPTPGSSLGSGPAVSPSPDLPKPTPVSFSRPFLVVVPNPQQGKDLVMRVRRFFPEASVLDGQPFSQISSESVIVTGSFSQLAQARQQVRDLAGLGFSSQVLEDQAGSATPAPTELWWVLVADPVGHKLTPIRGLISEAMPMRYDQMQVIQVGRFSEKKLAQEQVNWLNQQGVEAGIFPADPRRVQPLPGATP